MNRILFEQSEISADQTAAFGGTRAEHVLNVLHGEVGQTLKTGVLNGRLGTSVITGIERLGRDGSTGLEQGVVTVKCEHAEESLAPWVDLVLAPPRPRAMKRLLPQLAQLGVGKIVLVGAEKVEKAFWGAQLLKPQVYRPLLVDGLMQAGTTIVPEIRVERNFRAYVERGCFEDEFAGRGERVVAHPAVKTVEMPGGAEHPVLAVGPEGGWTDAEVEMLVRHGFACMSLGPRILRTDTALVALIARLMRI